MNKEYMLYALRERVKELLEVYSNLCNGVNEEGKQLTYGSAALRRSQVKRDLQILNLIEELLLTSEAVFIEDRDSIEAFDKLIEPKRRNIK